MRCQPQVMGAALDMLRFAAADTETGGERRLRQSVDLRGGSRKRCRAAISMPSRSPSPPTSSPRALRDRIALRAPHRHAGRPGALRPAGLPDAKAGIELRLHDPAGHRCRACFREQAACFSGERRIRSRPPRTRRIMSRCRRMARAGCFRWRTTSSPCSRIELFAAAQGCDFHAPVSFEPAARAGPRHPPRRRCRCWTRIGICTPISRLRRASSQRRDRRCRWSRTVARSRVSPSDDRHRQISRGDASPILTMPHIGMAAPPDIKADLVSGGLRASLQRGADVAHFLPTPTLLSISCVSGPDG